MKELIFSLGPRVSVLSKYFILQQGLIGQYFTNYLDKNSGSCMQLGNSTYIQSMINCKLLKRHMYRNIKVRGFPSCNSPKVHTCGSPLTSQMGFETIAVNYKWSKTFVLGHFDSLLGFMTLLVDLLVEQV